MRAAWVVVVQSIVGMIQRAFVTLCQRCCVLGVDGRGERMTWQEAWGVSLKRGVVADRLARPSRCLRRSWVARA
jgi:hypothetical protein